MNVEGFKDVLRKTYPSALISSQESGVCTWVRINVGERAFAIQVTPSEGIGVSEINIDADDGMSGHDHVVQSLSEALSFLRDKLAVA